jgi:hypothetical protein
MRKLLSFTAIFLGIAIISFAQSNIAFHITSKNGKIITQDKELYSMTFSISGLKTDHDVSSFTKTINSNSIVKHFEITPGTNEKNERKAQLILIKKEKEVLTELFKSAKVSTLIVDNKNYTIDQLEQISKDLKAKNQEKLKDQRIKNTKEKK